jgi:tRNA U34 5-methylaminomethyl-2-thiouridine-forming methyltransferase MnmC
LLNFVTTADGSKTLFNSEIGENYHSKHGALQESKHVFVGSGLKHFLNTTNSKKASILEVGFGTGLNFLLSAAYSLEHDIGLSYTGIEAFPLSSQTISQTAYEEYVAPELWKKFLVLYDKGLQQRQEITPKTSLKVEQCTLADFNSSDKFDVIYYDAFAAVHQPEMWEHEALEHTCSFIKPGGIFVTYAITGNLKRSMKALGFQIEKAPGAAGKREMLRATKIM